MATYTVTGHPLNETSLQLTATQQDILHQYLWDNGVGKSITVTLSGPDDLKVKAHGCLK